MNTFNYIVLLFLIALGFTSCLSYSNMQTARVLEKGESEISASLFFLDIPDLRDAGRSIGNPEVSYTYGLGKRFDIGLTYIVPGGLTSQLRYQFIGNETSRFASALGISAGFVKYELGDIRSERYQLSIPLNLTYFPTEKFAIYIVPKYLGFTPTLTNPEYTHIGIGSLGLQYGKKWIVGVEGSYFRQFKTDVGYGFQVGTGLKLRF